MSIILLPATQAQAAWAFQKESPYLEIFNLQLNKIKASGLSVKLLLQQLKDAEFASNCGAKLAFDEIKFESVLMAFVLLAVGVVAAVVTLVGERTRLTFGQKLA